MKKIIMLFLLVFSLKAVAAAPLMHLYWAQKWNENVEGFEKGEYQAFILGNLLPDIRYLVEIPREKTHFYGVSFCDVKEQYSPFMKGMIFHSVIDELREKVVMDSGIYSILEDVESDYLATLLKLVEDEILWEFYDGKKVFPFVKDVIEEELQTGIDPEMLKKWHGFLGYYLGSKPSQMLYSLALMDRPFFEIPVEKVERWVFLLPHLAENTAFRMHVENLLEKIQLEIDKKPCE